MQTASSTEAEGRSLQEGEVAQIKESHQPGRRRSAGGSTPRLDVDLPRTTASTSIRVGVAEKEGMGSPPASRRNISEAPNGMRPKYLRYNIWDPDSEFSPNTSDWTLTAKPLVGPPQSALDNEVVTKTLSDNPDLFRIVTPIQVDVFEAYLATHPNLPFIKSVCNGSVKDSGPGQRYPSLVTSVAEVLFRTAPENQNRQNRTVKFGSVLFSPRNSWSCSVLGSYI